jgi:hypothetical protein
MKDYILAWIERTANRIGVWAYNQKVKAKESWIKGYNRFKKEKE